MKKKYILPILFGLISNSVFAQKVGVNTDNPTRTLDVNGEMRIRTLSVATTTNDKSLLSVDADGNINSIKSVSSKFGDVKHGLEAADHNGWYLMNGRAVSTLPTVAQVGASTLGITALPNMADRMIRTQTSETIGSLAGSNVVTLSQANMPLYSTVNRSTTTNGNHSHTFEDWYEQVNAYSYRPGFSYGHNLQSKARTTSSVGNHAHTVTASTGGGGQSLNILPEFIAVNTFIYLGN